MNKYTFLTVSVISACLTISALSIVSASIQPVTLKSTPVGSEYHATTTDSTWAATNRGFRVVSTGSGALGSIIITKSTTATTTVYDATTSDVTLRTGNIASSSLIIADVAASAAAGTYTYDAAYQYGLLITTSSTGGVGSTTITWR